MFFLRIVAFSLQHCHTYHCYPLFCNARKASWFLKCFLGALWDFLKYFTPCSWDDAWSTTPGEGNNSCFHLPPYDLRDSGLVKYTLFGNSFVIFSSLMSINNCFSKVFRNLLFQPWHTSMPLCCEDRRIAFLNKVELPMLTPDYHYIDLTTWHYLSLQINWSS